MENKRDNVSNIFKTWKDINDINPVAADNILIARPEIHNIIVKNLDKNKQNRILEYWCWSWWHMIDLAKKWHSIIWIDSSNKMIELANQNISKLKEECRNNIIDAIVWDHNFLEKNATRIWEFDLIVSIMTLQFISNDDIDTTIESLNQSLKKGGIITFAVRNTDRINEGIEWYERFKHLETLNNWIVNCSVDFNWTWIDSYNRTSEYYDEIFDFIWYEKVHQASPPFTKGFIEKYKRDDPQKNSEYLILAYKKL